MLLATIAGVGAARGRVYEKTNSTMVGAHSMEVRANLSLYPRQQAAADLAPRGATTTSRSDEATAYPFLGGRQGIRAWTQARGQAAWAPRQSVQADPAALWVAYGRMYVQRAELQRPDGAYLGLSGVDPQPIRAGELIHGYATHYGISYRGRSLGCGSGSYQSENVSIVAVSPARYAEWPCGTMFKVRGVSGEFVGTRQDACPGCGANTIDLSEAGLAQACGPEAGSCAVTIEVLR